MTDRVVLWLLIAVCGALVYLDWQRQGAIEDLYAQVDRIDAAVRKRAPRSTSSKPKETNGNGGGQ